MTRIIPLLICAAGAAVWAAPDATPAPSRLELTAACTGLRGGAYTLHMGKLTEDSGRPACVSVRITKEDPDHGTLTFYQQVNVGDFLGWTGKPDLDGRTRYPDGALRKLLEKGVPVEFDPQAKLVSARQYPDWPVRRCRLIALPDGLGCMESVEKRVAVPVNEIVLQEKSGIRITLRCPWPGDKMPSDELCLVHGGKVRARLMTDLEKNDARASQQLSEADEGWKSKNPKVRRQAQEAYFKLLREYPSEAVVVRNCERIKARSEAEIDD